MALPSSEVVGAHVQGAITQVVLNNHARDRLFDEHLHVEVETGDLAGEVVVTKQRRDRDAKPATPWPAQQQLPVRWH